MMLPRFLSLGLLACAFAACGEAPKPHVVAEPPPAAAHLTEPQQIALVIDGMTCEACAKSVTTELRKTGAVGDCVVQVATKEAKLTYDAAKLKTDDLLIAVRRAGYTAKIKE